MRNAPVRKPGPAPTEKPRNALRKAAPLLEGATRLSDREIMGVISLFGSRSATRRYEAFMKARDEVTEDYGAVLEVVSEARMPTRVVARYEFRTTDKTLDPDLEELVSAMGFKLSLKSQPRNDLPLNERYERCTRVEGVLSPEPKVYVWYEQKADRTYVVEARSGTADVQYASRTAENFLRLLRMLRPPITEDMPELPKGVVDINSARPAPTEPVRGQVLAGQALTALSSS